MAFDIAFWLLAVVAVVTALAVVLLHDIFRAALALVACFVMVAGLYVTLSADFLAAIQILIYVGAVSILLLMAIMLTKDVQRGSPTNMKMLVPALIAAVVFLGVTWYAVASTPWAISTAAPVAPTTASLAGKLFGQNGYVLVVEIAAMLVLAAILGAIVLAREK